MKTNGKTQTDQCEESGLHELFLAELKDVLWAEQHILKALPKMEKAAQSDDLKQAFSDHRKQTENQVNRLEKVFEIIGEKPKAEKCEAMNGILEEGEELMKDFKGSSALDAALILAAQKVEHYEIASYGSLRTFAKRLGLTQAAKLLQQTLDEEGETDSKLTELAESMANEEAAESCAA